MAQYIIINAYKGGVLKTTITSNLGSILALNDKKILLVGLDAQDDLRISFNISEDKAEKNLYDLLVEDVDISECIYKYNDNIDLILSDERMENYEFDVLTNI
ncbi:AAA family ATPase, partial [Enterococcus faecium]|nr:AAA family ATPase [Enterococcus faecium]